MDKMFDRLGDLLRSVLNDDDRGKFRSGDDSTRFGDPDMQDAWDELNDFLNDRPHEKTQRPGASSRSYSGGSSSTGTQRKPSGPPVEILRDYKALEIEFGASMEAVKKAHKRLIVKNHPDRYAGNPEKQKTATEITQRINQAYQRIKKYQETGKI